MVTSAVTGVGPAAAVLLAVAVAGVAFALESAAADPLPVELGADDECRGVGKSVTLCVGAKARPVRASHPRDLTVAAVQGRRRRFRTASTAGESGHMGSGAAV